MHSSKLNNTAIGDSYIITFLNDSTFTNTFTKFQRNNAFNKPTVKAGSCRSKVTFESIQSQFKHAAPYVSDPQADIKYM